MLLYNIIYNIIYIYVLYMCVDYYVCITFMICIIFPICLSLEHKLPISVGKGIVLERERP